MPRRRVAREPLVHERVVRGVELHQAAILAHQVVEEHDRLGTHHVREVVVEVRIEVRIRLHLVDVLQTQPHRRKALAERLGLRILQHAAHLAIEHGRVVEPSLGGDGQQFLVGHRAPQEERETRREVDVRDAIDAVGAHRFGHALEAEDEMRARENGFNRRAHATFEAFFICGFRIELHEAVDLA
jgi:hypothetical protein